VKRSSLLQHLRRHGCSLKREGAAHSLWTNPATGAVEATPTVLSESTAFIFADNVPSTGTRHLPAAGRYSGGDDEAAFPLSRRCQEYERGARGYSCDEFQCLLMSRDGFLEPAKLPEVEPLPSQPRRFFVIGHSFTNTLIQLCSASRHLRDDTQQIAESDP
jgi:hypothetical protein